MNSPGKFGIGREEAPAPPPTEGQPQAPEIPAAEQPSPLSSKEKKIEEKSEADLVIEKPPRAAGETSEEPAETSSPAKSINISEQDLSGDIDMAAAAKLQDEINT